MAAAPHPPLPAEFLHRVAEVFRVLGDPSRLQILQMLMTGPQTVSQVVTATGMGQANVSKHLGVLAATQLVSRTKQGTQAIYEVADPLVYKLCDLVCGSVRARLQAQLKTTRQILQRT
ncbi:MAG: metalloregulator ArsR/SmtB family transcription factor [Phycisphaerae bacterium]